MKRKYCSWIYQSIFIGSLLILVASCKKTPEYSLKVDIIPAGSGTVSLSPDGGKYQEGTEITLTPNGTSTYKFLKWGGSDAINISNNKIIMSKNMTITANFEVLVTNGQWHGHYTGQASTSNDIQFFIKDNKITSDGSKLIRQGEAATRSMIVNLYFSNVTLTTYFSDDISITNNSFSYSSGDYKIAGNFTSATSCTGTVEFSDSRGDANYNFEATSLPGMPTLTTSTVSDITETVAKSGGNIVNDGGSAITAKGVCWSTTTNPTIADNKTNDGTGTGVFISTITGLSPFTIYYIRAYATNSGGTAYGDTKYFSTLMVQKPTLTTSVISDITQTTAKSGGNISNSGVSPVFERGVCWNISANPTIANYKITDGSGTGVFICTLTGLSPFTIYYVRAYATNSEGTGYGNEVSFTTDVYGKPTLTTTAISDITQTTALSGGNISDGGLSSVTIRGLCWNLSANPTVANSKTIDGAGTGSFTSNLTGLVANTTYYVRAYAVNDLGTSYGNELIFYTYTGSVSDYEGNTYHTVTIGTQLWMAENLKTTRYNDGSDIPLVTDNTIWAGLSTPAYCWYGNYEAAYKSTYGALYNWYAVNTNINGGKNVCPEGWHVPADDEWNILITYLGGQNVAGGKLKETGTAHWKSPNTGATNESWFTALPGGSREANLNFNWDGFFGWWWSTTENTLSNSWSRAMSFENSYLYREEHRKESGFSVRCLKDF